MTNDMLRALAVGIDRLNDGDDQDRQAAYEAQKALVLDFGLYAEHGRCYPVANVPDGYIQGGIYVCRGVGGGKPGDTLYLDPDCTVPLRTL